MKKTYEQYAEITKELLDSIKVWDLIKVNNWKKPLRVKGVSENYFVMARKQFKDTIYSVCEKKPWGSVRHNEMIGGMIGGMFHVGRDAWLFGWMGFRDCENGYDFENAEYTAKYLQSFENGASELSQRNAVPIRLLQIKRV